jgi:hypothetical protein
MSNDSAKPFPRKRMRATIGSQLLGNGSLESLIKNIEAVFCVVRVEWL